MSTRYTHIHRHTSKQTHTDTHLKEKRGQEQTDWRLSQPLVISINGSCARVCMNLKGEVKHPGKPIRLNFSAKFIHKKKKRVHSYAALSVRTDAEMTGKRPLVSNKNSTQLCVKLPMMDLQLTNQRGPTRQIKLALLPSGNLLTLS